MVLSIIGVPEHTISYTTVIFVLFFIINGQVRLNYLYRKKVLMMISFFIELIILYYGYKQYSGIMLFYYLPIGMDTSYLLRKPFNYFMHVLIYITILLLGIGMNQTMQIEDWLIMIGVLAIITFLNEYIQIEQQEKVKAQSIYNQLRISEDKLKKANQDLKEYANSIEELTLLKERNRISRDIHDSVGHSLSTIIIQLGAIEKLANENQDRNITQMAEQLRSFSKESLEAVRRAVRELKPKEYDEYKNILGLEELIKNFQKLSGVNVRLKVSKETWTLTAEQFGTIYRVVQEFLSNAIRHGQANKVDIIMNFTKESLIMILKDDGKGTNEIKLGIGLKGIEERVGEIGGDVDYHSSLGKGFYLKIKIEKRGINANGEYQSIISR